jgi:Uma2 family endonuclease
LIIMPPAHWFTAARGGEIFRQLGNWAIIRGGGLAVDASGGFRLPDGARLSADAAWISRGSIEGAKLSGRDRTWLLCPEFIVELRSQDDRLTVLRRKMREWIENGVQLGWLVDPERRAVEIYRTGEDPRILIGVDTVEGEGPVAGFTLDLKRVWDPLG